MARIRSTRARPLSGNRRGTAGALATLSPVADPFISETHRRRCLPLLAAAIVVVVIGVVAYLVLHGRTGDVHRGEKVEFKPGAPKRPTEKTLDWPFYHRDVGHSGYLPVRISPPFKRKWQFGGRVLMEFPPIVVGRTLYFVRNNGGTYALDSHCGRVKW
jgi:hypothetical protein